METSDEIVPDDERRSGITSHSLGVDQLELLLDRVGTSASLEEYGHAVIEENVLALGTDTGRDWRFATLRRLYQLRQDSVLFRALGDLWALDAEARPVLACLCALATDTVYRASATPIMESTPGDELTSDDFAEAIDLAHPDAYAESTLTKTAGNAYASWEQTGHLGSASGGGKPRVRAACTVTTVAYALMVGHLAGHRGEALFNTVWAQVLDRPTSHLHDLAFAASQQGMLEFRSAGKVIEVGFRELLRPMEEPA